jgi:recombination protein RecR
MGDNFFQELKSFFQKLPGIGPRQASRFIYSLVDFSDEDRKKMGELVLSLNQYLKRCEHCFRIFSGGMEICNFCDKNSRRDHSKIMIVEKDNDLINFEKTGVHKGIYFVLGNLFDPLDEEKNPKIRIEILKKNIEKFPDSEVILALPSTKLGDFTSEYIKTILSSNSIKMTRLGKGLSYGVELEYADESTLKHAFENRK